MAAAMMLPEYPPGIGFYPDEYELIEEYLVKKVQDCYEGYGVVTEAPVFDLEPDHLVQLANYRPGDPDGSFYFFAPLLRKDRNGKNAKRSRDGGGTWESTAKIAKIKDEKEKFIIGERRLLAYKIGVGEKQITTPWRIHEYRLAGDYKSLSSSARERKGSNFLELVLCRLFLSKREPCSIAQVSAEEEEGQFNSNNHGFHQEKQRQQASCSYTLQQPPMPPLEHGSSSFFYGSSSQQSSYKQTLEHELQQPLQFQPSPSSNLIYMTTNGGYNALLCTPNTEDVDAFALELEDIIGEAASPEHEQNIMPETDGYNFSQN